MSSRFTSLTGLILAFCLIQGCSSPESKERLDTALCWLRPSCLPSQPAEAKAPKTPVASKRLSTPPKPKPPEKAYPSKPKPTQQASSQNDSVKHCSPPAKTRIPLSKSDIRVSYREPTTNADEEALTNLHKTTIYNYLVEPRVKLKDCLATTDQGGGSIEEIISFTINQGESLQANICVTATNSEKIEGLPICKTIKK